MIDGVSLACSVQVPPQGFEMLPAFVAQIIGDPGRVGYHRLAFRVLAIQHAQRVPLQPPFVVLADFVVMLHIVFFQRFHVARPAFRTSGAVHLERKPLEAKLLQELPCHRHDLEIECRVLGAYCLHIELVELPEPASLRPFVPEERPDGEELDRLRLRVHSVLDVCTHDPGGELRAQSQVGLSLVLK